MQPFLSVLMYSQSAKVDILYRNDGEMTEIQEVSGGMCFMHNESQFCFLQRHFLMMLVFGFFNPAVALHT